MSKTRLLRVSAAAVTSLGLITGLAGIAGAATGNGSISNTGPNSTNHIVSHNTSHATTTNDNSVEASNLNFQGAFTGDSQVQHNTRGGDATTGDARNANSLNAAVMLDNSSSAGVMGGGSGAQNSTATIDTTGPRSSNVVKSTNSSTVTVNNTNTVELENVNGQLAASGDARVSGNTTGGSATSGDASNTNSSSFTIDIKN